MKIQKKVRHVIRIRNTMLLPGLIVFSQFYLFQPLLPVLSKSFSVSITSSSLTISATMVGVALGLFVFAFYADKFLRKKLMIGAMFFSSLVTMVSALSWSFEMLIVFCFIKGILVSGVLAVALVYISEEVSESSIGIVIGFYLMGNILGGMWGRVCAGLISDVYGWRIATVIIGVIGFLLLALFFKYLPESLHFYRKKSNVGHKLIQMKTFLKTPLFLGFSVMVILIMGTFVSIYNYLSYRLETPSFLLSKNAISLVFLVYITGAIATILIGKLSNKISLLLILKILIFLFLIGAVALIIEQLWVLIIGLCLLTFSVLGIQTIISKMIAECEVEEKSTLNCLYLICYYIGAGSIGSLTGNVLSGWGWIVFISVLISFIFFSGFLTVVYSKFQTQY